MRAVYLKWVGVAGLVLGMMAGLSGVALAADDWFEAVSGESGLVLSGFVQDDKTLDTLSQQDDTDVTALAISADMAGDADTAIEFGLDVLATLEIGEFSIHASMIRLSGTVSDDAALAEAEALVDAGAPLGYYILSSEFTLPEPEELPDEGLEDVAQTEMESPAPYNWAAEMGADGAINLSGSVPHENLRNFLAVRAGSVGEDNTEVNPNAPEGFVSNAVSGVTALAQLESGRVSFDGEAWSISGEAASAAATDAAVSGLDETIWSIDVSIAEQTAAETNVGFAWNATKAEDGTIVVSGSVPSQILADYLADVPGVSGADTLTVRGDAPSGFVPDARAGLEALGSLKSGQVDYNEMAGWYLEGQPDMAADAVAATAALGRAASPLAEWLTNLSAPLTADEPEEMAEPEEMVEMADMPDEPGTPELPTLDPDFAFSAILQESGKILLTGNVPAEATGRFFAVIAGGDVLNATVPAEGAPPEFLATAGGVLRLMRQLEEGILEVNARDGWSLSGTAMTDYRAGQFEDEVEQLDALGGWTFDLGGASAFAYCQDAADALTADNSILFGSGSTAMTADSLPLLDALSEVLLECPNTTVEVEGHTDSDGPDTLNMALSVARAEAVVDRLIADGINPARLYAIGYGESLPVASNDTRDGKRRNRRIVISVVEDYN